MGVAISYTIATTFFLPITGWFFVHKKLKASVSDIIYSMLKYLLISSLLGFIVFYLNFFFTIGFLYQLIFIPILFLIAYWFFLKIMTDKSFEEIRANLVGKI